MTQEASGSPFFGTAWYYARFRPQYPPQLIDDVIRELGLDGRGRLLDLGCGTGMSSLPFRQVFEEIVGVDPDAEMIDEARRQSAAVGAANCRWECMRAEDVSSEIGAFRLVVLGQSFHWMERERVLGRAYDLTTAGGGIAFLGMPGSWWEGVEPWHRIVIDVVRRWLGDERRAGGGTFKHPPKRWEEYLEESPYTGMTEVNHSFSYEWTADSIIGYLYSTSFAAKPLFGDNAGEFEKEVRNSLREHDSGGVYREELTGDALIAWKA